MKPSFKVVDFTIKVTSPPNPGPCYGCEDEPPTDQPASRIPTKPKTPAATAEKEPVRV